MLCFEFSGSLLKDDFLLLHQWIYMLYLSIFFYVLTLVLGILRRFGESIRIIKGVNSLTLLGEGNFSGRGKSHIKDNQIGYVP